MRVTVKLPAEVYTCVGLLEVALAPSPKSHRLLPGETLVFVKFTVNGTEQAALGFPVKLVPPPPKTVTVFVMESLHPPKLLTNFTL